MIPRIFFIFIGYLLVFSSCGKQHFHIQESTLEDAIWRSSDTLDFEFSIKDTTSRYDIQLGIEHFDEYTFQNLYLKILTDFPDGKQLDQVLSVDLADSKGQWHGKCSGRKCKLGVVLQQNAIFNQIGIHHIRLAQYMRQEQVSGIESVSLILNKIGEN